MLAAAGRASVAVIDAARDAGDERGIEGKSRRYRKRSRRLNGATGDGRGRKTRNVGHRRRIVRSALTITSL